MEAVFSELRKELEKIDLRMEPEKICQAARVIGSKFSQDEKIKGFVLQLNGFDVSNGQVLPEGFADKALDLELTAFTEKEKETLKVSRPVFSAPVPEASAKKPAH